MLETEGLRRGSPSPGWIAGCLKTHCTLREEPSAVPKPLADKILVEAGSISLSDLLSCLNALSSSRPIRRFPS